MIYESSQKVKETRPVIFLNTDEVISIHDRYIVKFGGLGGIRDQGLLESAVFAPQATFGGVFLYEDIFQMAAALCHSIIKNHPFFDGNKRTGSTSAIFFLKYNGLEIEFKQGEIYEFAIAVAIDEISQEDLGAYFKSKCSV